MRFCLLILLVIIQFSLKAKADAISPFINIEKLLLTQDRVSSEQWDKIDKVLLPSCKKVPNNPKATAEVRANFLEACQARKIYNDFINYENKLSKKIGYKFSLSSLAAGLYSSVDNPGDNTLTHLEVWKYLMKGIKLDKSLWALRQVLKSVTSSSREFIFETSFHTILSSRAFSFSLVDRVSTFLNFMECSTTACTMQKKHLEQRVLESLKPHLAEMEKTIVEIETNKFVNAESSYQNMVLLMLKVYIDIKKRYTTFNIAEISVLENIDTVTSLPAPANYYAFFLEVFKNRMSEKLNWTEVAGFSKSVQLYQYKMLVDNLSMNEENQTNTGNLSLSEETLVHKILESFQESLASSELFLTTGGI